MRRTNIYLDEDQTKVLDRLADEDGTSRAEVIRRLLARALAGKDHVVDVDLGAIRSSFGVLAGAAAVEREPDARQQHLDRMWRLRA
jgi:hypothetical protein